MSSACWSAPPTASSAATAWPEARLPTVCVGASCLNPGAHSLEGLLRPKGCSDAALCRSWRLPGIKSLSDDSRYAERLHGRPVTSRIVMAPRIDSRRIKHIFRAARGHLPDTPANRRMLQDVASDPSAFVEQDRFGNKRYVRLLTDGRQVWVQVREGVIVNGGANSVPRAREVK